MTTHVALLRGINVGGNVKVPMAELRALASGLGWGGVATHLASGNLLLDTTGETAAEVASRLEAALADRFGRVIRVVVRTPDELRAARARHPVTDGEPKRLHVGFLDRTPTAAAVAALAERAAGYAPDTCVVDGREVFLHYPGGQARTQLTTNELERRLEVAVTVRGVATLDGILARASAA